MNLIRPSDQRGHLNFGWLDTYHSFSFGEYYDPNHVGFGPLRVINEDRISPGTGFGTHPHKDMEILTFMISGSLSHRDSTGGEGVIREGEVQVMSAGTGIYHSERNEDPVTPAHLLQIWIRPRVSGLPPRYAQKRFKGEEGQRLIASPEGQGESLRIHQDADIYSLKLREGARIAHRPRFRRVWVQLIKGALDIDGTSLQAGDGFGSSSKEEMILFSKGETEALLFDLT